MIFITSFDRPAMLMRLLKELRPDLIEGEKGVVDVRHKDSPPPREIVVIDDGSDYDPTPYLDYCDYYRTPHRGKKGFWMQWNMMLEIAGESDHERFFFLVDDWRDVDLKQANWYLDNVDKPFAFNFTNNGVKTNWTPIKRQKAELAGNEVYKAGFVDCGFFCPRSALEKIGFYMDEVPVSRFQRDNISSGVGQQLSNRFMYAFVPMYQPVTSLAWHDGTHESKMHPEHRKEVPLIPR